MVRVNFAHITQNQRRGVLTKYIQFRHLYQLHLFNGSSPNLPSCDVSSSNNETGEVGERVSCRFYSLGGEMQRFHEGGSAAKNLLPNLAGIMPSLEKTNKICNNTHLWHSIGRLWDVFCMQGQMGPSLAKCRYGIKYDDNCITAMSPMAFKTVVLNCIVCIYCSILSFTECVNRQKSISARSIVPILPFNALEYRSTSSKKKIAIIAE